MNEVMDHLAIPGYTVLYRILDPKLALKFMFWSKYQEPCLSTLRADFGVAASRKRYYFILALDEYKVPELTLEQTTDDTIRQVRMIAAKHVTAW